MENINELIEKEQVINENIEEMYNQKEIKDTLKNKTDVQAVYLVYVCAGVKYIDTLAYNVLKKYLGEKSTHYINGKGYIPITSQEIKFIGDISHSPNYVPYPDVRILINDYEKNYKNNLLKKYDLDFVNNKEVLKEYMTDENLNNNYKL